MGGPARPNTISDMNVLSTKMRPPLKTYTVGRIRISGTNRREAIETFFQLIKEKIGGFITVRDAHGIVESQTDIRLRDIINGARMTLPDGMPIVWIGKWKGVPVQRVTGVDFADDIMRDPRARYLRHYFYGGKIDSNSRIVAYAEKLLGKNAIAGWLSPPFRPAGSIEDPTVIKQIAATKPDVIWVGLSTPKQEYWMANHAACFPNTIFVGIGAAFDFLAGTQQRAPSFVQQIGFEWLYRLTKEPKRLWPRYKRVVPAMLKIIILELLHGQ
jgi:N-acetylglucosaminyldiphosphoundecaprenol N-acetyl-beta-D-mannosaminyltransferase